MTAPSRLVLALPSKGRLQEMALGFLKGCGFEVRRVGAGREYVSRLGGIDDVDVLYARPEEIPRLVDRGDAHCGVTGEDLYREYGDGNANSFLVMPGLGFGAARLVVAVPQSWVDVASMDDLIEAAMLFHQKNGRSLRAATKFARLTRGFLAERGLVEYALIGSQGATEGAPQAGTADFIVDLTSTGTTLAENHLKEIAGGTVLETQAILAASSRKALWSAPAIAALKHLVAQIEARMRATATAVLRFSMPAANAASARADLESRLGCTVSSWRPGTGRSGRDDVVALCARSRVYGVVSYLRTAGAAEVIVAGSDFVFEEASPAFDRFRSVVPADG